jgi:hypothetical protein
MVTSLLNVAALVVLLTLKTTVPSVLYSSNALVSVAAP